MKHPIIGFTVTVFSDRFIYVVVWRDGLLDHERRYRATLASLLRVLRALTRIVEKEQMIG